MKVAIIGLPMSGKTTLFRLLTGAVGGDLGGARSGRAVQRQTRVEDARLDRLARDFKPKKVTPAVIDFLDFPPLVRVEGGERRSSAADLLAPAREAGALILVVRAFDNPALPPLRGRVDPAADLDDLGEELRLADLEITIGRYERVEEGLPCRRSEDVKEAKAELELLARIRDHLEGGGELRDLELTADEAKRIRGFQYLSRKPRLVVENVTDGATAARLDDAIPVPVALELEVQELDEESRELFRGEYGLGEPCAGPVIREIYRRAGLLSFLTVGEPEVRAWTIPAGTPAVEAAGAIHSDMARGFIRAEVLAYDDYIADGGHAGARDKGHLRLEGKDYVVQDGDIVLFRFNV